MTGRILAVNEIFGPTIQGEGLSLGEPTFFLRLAGCNLRCSFCFAAGSMVLMADWTQKPIEDLSEGDLVISYRDRGYMVSQVLKTYQREAETVRVVTEAGEVVCTPDHVFHTNHHRSGRRKAEARDLTGLWVKRSKLGLHAALPVSDDYLRGYLQGAYAGDGSASSWGGHVKYYFQVTDLDFAERLQEIINRYGHSVNITVSKRRTKKDKKVYRVSFGSRRLEFILGFPENDEQARGYVAGFFDAEGSVGRGQLSLAQQDPKLLHRVEDMLQSFGFSPTFAAHPDGMNSLIVNGADNCERFMATFAPAIERKRSKMRGDLKRQMTSVLVTEVLPDEPQPVYNVMTTIGNLFVNGFLVDQCDTWYSWDWSRADVRKESHTLTVDDVLARLLDLRKDLPIRHLVVSGGEPMLQQSGLDDLARHLPDWFIEVETAGTKVLQFDFADQYNVSLKLASSGNGPERLNPAAIRSLLATGKANWKFVVFDASDFQEIDTLVREYRLAPVVIMPEGIDAGVISDRSKAIVPLAIEHGYRVTTRLHISLFGNRRGV